MNQKISDKDSAITTLKSEVEKANSGWNEEKSHFKIIRNRLEEESHELRAKVNTQDREQSFVVIFM